MLRCVGVCQTSATTRDKHDPEWMMGGSTPWNKHSDPPWEIKEGANWESKVHPLQLQCDIQCCRRSHFSWWYYSPFAQTCQRWACYPNKLCVLGELLMTAILLMRIKERVVLHLWIPKCYSHVWWQYNRHLVLGLSQRHTQNEQFESSCVIALSTVEWIRLLIWQTWLAQ